MVFLYTRQAAQEAVCFFVSVELDKKFYLTTYWDK